MSLQFPVQTRYISSEEAPTLPRSTPCLSTSSVHCCVYQVTPRRSIFSNCRRVAMLLTIIRLTRTSHHPHPCKLRTFYWLAHVDVLNRQRRSSFQHIGRSMGSFLPDRLTDMWEPSRHFASLKLPNVGVRSLVALSRYGT